MRDFNEYVEYAEKLKVIAHPHRLCIIKGLLEKERNVSTIQACLGLPQSTISQHLSKLKNAGIILGERAGTEICYKVIDKKIIEIVNLL